MDRHQQLLLVDHNDNFSGQYADRLSCHTGKGLHHRAFVVVIFNSQNEILLQKRKHILWDGYWDVTAISHVLHKKDYDESYKQAAYRALNNEMGIPEIPIKNIGGFNYFAKYHAYCENEYCAVLVGKWEGNIRTNPAAVYEYKWMIADEFYTDTKMHRSLYAPWTILTAELLQSSPMRY